MGTRGHPMYERVHPRHSRFPTGQAAAHISRQQRGAGRARADIWAFFQFAATQTDSSQEMASAWGEPAKTTIEDFQHGSLLTFKHSTPTFFNDPLERKKAEAKDSHLDCQFLEGWFLSQQYYLKGLALKHPSTLFFWPIFGVHRICKLCLSLTIGF